MKHAIIAHRGWPKRAHENTLDAFAAALSLSVDYIECDVRRSLDGIYFIHHDDFVGSCPTRTSTFADVFRAGKRLGYEIPTLSELLSLPLGRTRVDFELKEVGYELDVVNEIRKVITDNNFVITAFEDGSLSRIKHAFPMIRCGLLLGIGEPKHLISTRIRELFPISRARSVGADFLAPHWKLLRFGFVKRARAAGFPLWVWTVDDPLKIEELLRSGDVEAIITDVPDIGLCKRDHSAVASRDSDAS